MRGEIRPESRIIFWRLRRLLQFGLAEFFSADIRLRLKIRRRWRPNSAALGFWTWGLGEVGALLLVCQNCNFDKDSLICFLPNVVFCHCLISVSSMMWS